MPTDLLSRPDVQLAISTGHLGKLTGPARASLERRGLLESKYIPGYRIRGGRTGPARTEWHLTPAGLALQAKLRAEEQARIQAERDAKGNVTVPRWAVEKVLDQGRYLNEDVAEALRKALGVDDGE